jgi:hypothetical protein
MAFELGHSVESVNCLINRFEKDYKLIKYNPQTKEIAIKNWGKYNLNRGGKPVMDCLTSELSKVKDKSLIEYVSKKVKSEAIRKLYETFIHSDTIREGGVLPKVDNTNTSTSTNTSTYTDTSACTCTTSKVDTDRDNSSHEKSSL